ncbi:MAG: O-antigen ligase family protein, partial [Flavobacteriaceae bacterium]|nr:O-antigen ligase family protein [Flavobacteriaceae bacterium]
MRVLLASIYPFIFLLLFFTIPFDMYFRALPNVLLIILAVLFPIVVTKEDFKKIKKIAGGAWLLFFLYVTLIILLSGRWELDWVVLKKILLTGALVILYLPVNNFKKINKAIIFSSLAAILYALIKLFILINQGVEFTFLESATLIEAMLMDRIYLGVLAVLSILVSYDAIKASYHPDNRYYLANIVLNVLFILFIVSRIAIITLLVIFILSLFHSKKRGPQLLFATGGILLVAALVFVLNKDLRKKIFYANNIQKHQGLVANTMAYEPRAIVWGCALKVSEQNDILLKGIGFTKTNQKLLECYETTIDDNDKKNWFVNQKYNAHNQFFDLYLATGIVA